MNEVVLKYFKLFCNLYISIFFTLFLCTIHEYTLKEVLICTLLPMRIPRRLNNNTGKLKVLKEKSQAYIFWNELESKHIITDLVNRQNTINEEQKYWPFVLLDLYFHAYPFRDTFLIFKKKNYNLSYAHLHMS